MPFLMTQTVIVFVLSRVNMGGEVPPLTWGNLQKEEGEAIFKDILFGGDGVIFCGRKSFMSFTCMCFTNNGNKSIK